MKKALISAALVGAALKLVLMAGADEGLGHVLRLMGSDSALISATIDLELGGAVDGVDREAESEPEIGETAVGSGERPPEQAVNLGEEQAAAVTGTTIVGSLSVRNDSTLDIDCARVESAWSPPQLSADQPQVLIIHTHGSEAYTQSPGDIYEESDPYRTQDCEHNVIRLGDVLEQVLENCGLQVIHDRGIYDYPSYTGSYSRSGAAVEDWLERYPGIEIVIDLHRDAIGSGDVVYKTVADVEGESCAQVMLLVGTGANGLSHPGWKDNLGLAIAMQRAMDEAYPTLARPLAIKSERYNQHLTAGSLILEVGSTGNSLAEAVRAVELFGRAVGPMLAGFLVG